MTVDKASWLIVIVIAALGAFACKPEGSVDPSIVEAEQAGAWATYEALEARIAAGAEGQGEGASEADRVTALEQVRAAADDDSAAYAYARAAVAGRVAELRGLRALDILEEMQTWSKRSIERDPAFMDMAAQRMLGTLYVLASKHLDEGDSEEGLELLESVVDAHPDAAINHLRLAEGYISLGDPDPAFDELCAAQAGRASLAAEERVLLDRLIADVGGGDALGCAPPPDEGSDSEAAQAEGAEAQE
ncbi:hypothetical protein G6O69_30655 [Pseudenhygromyxa sp. WMMC2535]|uniref:tetratricopeptide repeat protein n=1 Tax=Pseudenhygromyxa sp. WMMC2535 TaxID=2712867 RepID=UPI0015563EBD|nr:hypothetical protein [Pseudenhygromyxa sp. WMMC2535]NVB42224.1 hypothetical protein [Pseudenhygromyxa sp. WMMC2535]